MTESLSNIPSHTPYGVNESAQTAKTEQRASHVSTAPPDPELAERVNQLAEPLTGHGDIPTHPAPEATRTLQDIQGSVNSSLEARLAPLAITAKQLRHNAAAPATLLKASDAILHELKPLRNQLERRREELEARKTAGEETEADESKLSADEAHLQELESTAHDYKNQANQADLVHKLATRYGNFPLKETFEETMVAFCETHGISHEELTREAALLGSTVEEVAAKIGERARDAIDTEYRPRSVISAVEACWAKIEQSKSQESRAKEIEGHLVVFMPAEKQTIVGGRQLGAGAIKAVFDTSVSSGTTPTEEGLVLIRSKSANPKDFNQDVAQMILAREVKGTLPFHLVTAKVMREGVPTTETVIVQEKAGWRLACGAQPLDMRELGGLNLEGQLTPDEQLQMLSLFIQGAQVLQNAHQAGILHLDVKAEQFLVTKGGKEGVLSDFGFARRKEDIVQGEEELKGSPPHLSLARWEGITDESGDVYALGISLWEIFGGGSNNLDILPLMPQNLDPETNPNYAADISNRLAELRDNPDILATEYPEPTNKQSIAYVMWRCLQPTPPPLPEVISLLEATLTHLKQMDPEAREAQLQEQFGLFGEFSPEMNRRLDEKLA